MEVPPWNWNPGPQEDETLREEGKGSRWEERERANEKRIKE